MDSFHMAIVILAWQEQDTYFFTVVQMRSPRSRCELSHGPYETCGESILLCLFRLLVAQIFIGSWQHCPSVQSPPLPQSVSGHSRGTEWTEWIYITRGMNDWLALCRLGSPTVAVCTLERLRTRELLSPLEASASPGGHWRPGGFLESQWSLRQVLMSAKDVSSIKKRVVFMCTNFPLLWRHQYARLGLILVMSDSVTLT